MVPGYLPAEILGVRVTAAGEPLAVLIQRGRTLTLTPMGDVAALDQREVVLVRADLKLPDGPVPVGHRTLRHEEGRLQARTLAPGSYRLVSTDRDLMFDPEFVEVADRDVTGEVRVSVRK
jgi:hypothetical protein